MNKFTRRRFLAATGVAGLAASSGAVFGNSTSNSVSPAHPVAQQKTSLKAKRKSMAGKVQFKRDGLILTGLLYTPTNFNPGQKYGAVIVAGSFTAVKEQMAATYSEKFAEQGLVALALDYAHYGESEGSPRQYESPEEKLADLKAAVTYLTGLPYVSGVGMVGVCTSGGNAMYLAADEPRIKAVAAVAGAFFDPASFTAMFGEAELDRRRQAAADARLKYEQSGEVVMVPAYSHTDKSAVNIAPEGVFDYYFNPRRGGVPEYKNAFAVMAYPEWLNFDPITKAGAVEAPTIVVHSDGCAAPEQAKKVYALLKGEKALAWGDGTHFDYYDHPAQVNYAVKNITEFFGKHL